MLIFFVSGHLDLTQEEFNLHYKPKIDYFIDHYGVLSVKFVVGDARGCDIMAQEYIHEKQAIFTVYHMFDTPRNVVEGWDNLSGGYQSDEERDVAMTNVSLLDIAWVRDGRHRSGTRNNLNRRVSKIQQDEFERSINAIKIETYDMLHDKGF